MSMIIETLARELGQKTEYVQNVVALLDEGNTIPFIARYRKELHNSMDDTTLRNLETRLKYLRNLEQRKQARSFAFNRIVNCIVCKCEKMPTVKMILKGYKDGKQGNLGATVKPGEK